MTHRSTSPAGQGATPPRKAQLLASCTKARQLLERQEWQLAASLAMSELIVEWPHLPQGYFVAATAMVEQRRYDEAVEHYACALELMRTMGQRAVPNFSGATEAAIVAASTTAKKAARRQAARNEEKDRSVSRARSLSRVGAAVASALDGKARRVSVPLWLLILLVALVAVLVWLLVEVSSVAATLRAQLHQTSTQCADLAAQAAAVGRPCRTSRDAAASITSQCSAYTLVFHWVFGLAEWWLGPILGW